MSAIRFQSISKRFPGVVALDDVSFEIPRGSCHALMGENGAGKSTLGKLLGGIYRPDAGHIELDGAPVHFHSPLDARRAGIGIVHQELAYCPNLSVAENLCLGALPSNGMRLDRASLRQTARALLNRIGADCNVDDEMGRLSTAQIQMVQIAAALGAQSDDAQRGRVLIMDEPTSSLSIADTQRLYEIIDALKEQGATIIYVSHRMEEIFRVCDSVTVLRDGRHVETRTLAGTTRDDLVRMMIGRPVGEYFPAHAQNTPGTELLRVENITRSGQFQNISFSVRAGEVLGLAGLVGAGRSEVALGIFGLLPLSAGEVFIKGRRVTIASPRDAMALGIGLVPEDRKRQGLVLSMTSGENITLACLERLRTAGFIRRGAERAIIAEYFSRLRVRAPNADTPAAGLSGGNQQKLVLAKWLARNCEVLIFDEPTRGVDVGAKAEIHALIDDLAASGHGVILISSEMPEILNLSTRIVVLRQGRFMGELARGEATQERVMQRMAGIGG